jgi:hypothetical protein
MCPSKHARVESLKVDDVDIQSVSSFKLYFVSILIAVLSGTATLIQSVLKVSSYAYFLKHLRRSGVELEDLLYFYYSVILPVFEYACPAWHTCLTRDQSDRLEIVYKKGFIYNQCKKYNAVFCSSNLLYVAPIFILYPKGWETN